MPPVGLISPASSAWITPGSQTSLHVSGGETRSAVTNPALAVTHPHILHHPFHPKLSTVGSTGPFWRKEGQTSLFQVQRHSIKSFHNKDGGFCCFFWQSHGPGGNKGLEVMFFVPHEQISSRHVLHTPEVPSVPNSFLLQLCSRRNIFHFLRNNCYDSHMD